MRHPAFLNDNLTVIDLKCGHALVSGCDSIEWTAGEWVEIRDQGNQAIKRWTHDEWAKQPDVVMSEIGKQMADPGRGCPDIWQGESRVVLAGQPSDRPGEVRVEVFDGFKAVIGIRQANDGAGFFELLDSEGEEYQIWSSEEWACDAVLVMGAIVNSAAGVVRMEKGHY